MRGMIYCGNGGDVPKVEHYAILEFGQIYIEGDERSRTNPGHGYPGGYENTTKYIAFTNIDEWKTEISRRQKDSFYKDKFIAIKSTPATIKTEIQVSIT